MRPVLIAGVLLFAASACDSTPVAPRPAPARKPAPAAAEAATEAEGEKAAVAVEYQYSPVGKRDPFRSVFDLAEVLAKDSEVDPDCGVPCQWELDQLRLVAVVSGVASPLAMVEDPEGRGHMIRRGSHLGKRSGRVSEIRRDRIVITELLRDKQGQVIPVKTEMVLRAADGKRADNQVVDLTMGDR